jgi:3-deoxy-D-manno-octulosonic acid (KDO) 8-phosphate synthase
MKEIASTEFYSILIDTGKNRMFLTYKGSWMKHDDVPDFVNDHARAMERLSRGFTVLADVRPMQAMLITDVIEKVQKDSIQAGIRKAARVYDRPTFIRRQADQIRQKTGLKAMVFDSVADAEAWLDEP